MLTVLLRRVWFSIPCALGLWASVINAQQTPDSTFFTFLANTRSSAFVQLPGLALPVGMTADGLPVGIELDGPVGTDRRLLSIGLAVESVLGPVPAPGR